jgi:putative hydroxymethylpyrimidine transport system ATP-binding protein
LTGRVAYMAQQDLLLPWLNVLDNVTLGSRLRGERPDRERALNLLARVGLADFALARPDTLVRRDAPAGGAGPDADGRSARSC